MANTIHAIKVALEHGSKDIFPFCKKAYFLPFESIVSELLITQLREKGDRIIF